MMYFSRWGMEEIRNRALEQLNNAAKIERLFMKGDVDRVLSAAEKAMISSSKLYMMYREFILSLYAANPSRPRTVDVSKVDAEAMKVSVDQVENIDFPAYRITVPFLLPNKRKNCTSFKTAITEAVRNTAIQFCEENCIRPFESATVIFLSFYDQNPMLVPDNDNKESAVIFNALWEVLIRDDNCAACHSAYYSRRVEKGRKTEIYVVDADHDLELLNSLLRS